MNSHLFNKTILDYYKNNKRELPWRNDSNPYHILVSEIMLQQTQVKRVIPKYKHFLKAFPTIEKLSESSLGKVLTTWQGLGYNRRAKQLWETAGIISNKYKGIIPTNINKLIKLPGIGMATAGAVITYSYNISTIFVETNIRAVFLYFFFKNDEKVVDKEIEEKIKLTVDKKNPREWYYAVVDYGVYLKKQYKFKNTQSKHYIKQSSFHGSLRQVRGMILKNLSIHKKLSEKQLFNCINNEIDTSLEKFKTALSQLVTEGLLINKNQTYSLP